MEDISRIITSFAFDTGLMVDFISVIEKKSSRKNVQYVGPITEPRVLRYYTCLHLEVGLLALEQIVTSALIPDFIWEMCRRWFDSINVEKESVLNPVKEDDERGSNQSFSLGVQHSLEPG